METENNGDVNDIIIELNDCVPEYKWLGGYRLMLVEDPFGYVCSLMFLPNLTGLRALREELRIQQDQLYVYLVLQRYKREYGVLPKDLAVFADPMIETIIAEGKVFYTWYSDSEAYLTPCDPGSYDLRDDAEIQKMLDFDFQMLDVYSFK